MNTENVWKSGLQAAKLLSGSRLQIVFLLKKEPMSEKQLAGYMDEDEQGVGTELCVLQAVGLVSAEKEGTAAISCVRRRKPGGMEDLSGVPECHSGCFRMRAHRTDDVRFHLTELGEELLPLCRELERFGRLYEAAKDLVPELMGANDIPGQNLTGLQQAAQMQVPHKIRKTILTICLRKKLLQRTGTVFIRRTMRLFFSIRTVNLKTGIFMAKPQGR